MSKTEEYSFQLNSFFSGFEIHDFDMYLQLDKKPTLVDKLAKGSVGPDGHSLYIIAKHDYDPPIETGTYWVGIYCKKTNLSETCQYDIELTTLPCNNNCSKHGRCYNLVCYCDKGWTLGDCSGPNQVVEAGSEYSIKLDHQFYYFILTVPPTMEYNINFDISFSRKTSLAIYFNIGDNPDPRNHVYDIVERTTGTESLYAQLPPRYYKDKEVFFAIEFDVYILYPDFTITLDITEEVVPEKEITKIEEKTSSTFAVLFGIVLAVNLIGFCVFCGMICVMVGLVVLILLVTCVLSGCSCLVLQTTRGTNKVILQGNLDNENMYEKLVKSPQINVQKDDETKLLQ